jgi:hypothetical protein
VHRRGIFVSRSPKQQPLGANLVAHRSASALSNTLSNIAAFSLFVF